MALAKVLFSP
jgi:uncharacterized membrane protein YqiK